MPDLTRRRSLMGYVLRPIAWQLALASRLAAPSSNKLITAAKSSHCTQSRFIMDFRTNEGQQKVQAWYKYQGAKTRFTHLEYRKVKHGKIKHEFIVARISSTTLCRFDRRPRDKERGSAFLDEGAPAEDSAHVLSSFETAYEDLLRDTEVLLTIKLPRGEDLSFILAVCEAIQTHGEASAYNLMRYNCYFFSWMIVAAIARSTYDWETVVLSEAGWDELLRSSFEHAFQDKPGTTLPERAGMRRWLGRTAAKIGLHLKSPSTNLPEIPPDTETFRDALLAVYSNFRGNVQGVLRVLLLRSQLGSALVKKELHRMESSVFLSAKLAVAMNRVEISCPWPLSARCRGPCSCTPPRKILTDASRASAVILSAEKHPGSSPTNNPREESWMDVWRDTWGNSYNKFRGSSHLVGWARKNMDLVMIQWKNAWDEVDALSAQYNTTITISIANTMLEYLTDVSPEHLVLGDNAHYRKFKTGSSKGPPSLQEFIRSRMQDHFEMVDRFGFGSFQELITTAEEAMCEIWIASLDTIESSRYRT